LGRNPSGRLKPLRPDLEDRNFDQEEEKRPASNHSSILSRQASEPIEKQYIPDDDNMSVHSTASRRSESRISGPLNGLKNYPPSIKAADKRAERISSGLDGKAFLMDIDNKFDNQDKLINHLIEQINSMSVKVDSVNRNQKMIQDTERDARMKIESNFKMNSDESNFSLSELMSKISTMDEKLRRDDQIKNELRDRVMVAEGNQRELMTFMSQTKKQDEAELKQLRNMLQEIHSDDQVDKSKNNE
jgi:hypothetical protein